MHAHGLVDKQMNNVPPDFWPQISIAINVVIAVLGYLLVRWIAGQIRIAILELENRLMSLYATKVDLEAAEERLDKKIELKAHLDTQFAKLRELLPHRPTGASGVR